MIPKSRNHPFRFFIFAIMYRYLISFFLLIICVRLNASISTLSEIKLINVSSEKTLKMTIHENIRGVRMNSPNKLFLTLRKRLHNSKKGAAAAMAFPIPFGIVGLHRIYLGTKPYVPLVYIATVGGCFGILPLIDFFVIVLEADSEKFVNNPRVFMWAK